MSFVGCKIKLFLINSLSAEGIVESWDDNKICLLSNGRKLFINNPSQNVIMYYLLSQDAVENNLTSPSKPYVEEENLKEEPQNISDLSLKFKKIADLKLMAAEVQREQIRKELTTFHSVNTDQILGKYGTPSFIKPQHSPSEKNNDGNADDLGGMSKVPRKAP